MPKEKATRKTKAKAVSEGGKKKKGTRSLLICHFEPESALTACAADPNAPKRGLSAYMFFANEQRENVRDENPGISFGQSPYRLASASAADTHVATQARSAKFLGSGGRHSMPSSASRTSRRRRRTRSAMRARKPATL